MVGITGFTAWVGMLLIGIPQPGENIYVSAAAGAVGMYAGQLAKIKGCRVVGSTGTDEKVYNSFSKLNAHTPTHTWHPHRLKSLAISATTNDWSLIVFIEERCSDGRWYVKHNIEKLVPVAYGSYNS